MAPSFYDIFYNPLLLHLIAPHLSLGDKCAIIQTCKGFRTLFLENGSLYGYLELRETVEEMLAGALLSSPETQDVGDEINNSSLCEYEETHALRKNFLPEYNLVQLGEYVTLPPNCAHSIRTHDNKLKDFSKECRVLHKTQLISMILDDEEPFLGSAYRYRLLRDLFHIHVRFIRATLNVRIGHAQLLQHVRVLVLDNITIPAERVVCDILQIVSEKESRLSLLSVRGTRLNSKSNEEFGFGDIIDMSRKTLQSSRSSQPPIGIYVFGPSESTEAYNRRLSVRADQGNDNFGEASNSDNMDVTQGDELLDKKLSTVDKWYKSYGSMFDFKEMNYRDKWATHMYQLCNHNTLGLSFAFDAVLCRGPRHDEEWVKAAARLHGPTAKHNLSHLFPSVASVALGPGGCVNCGSSPEGPASYQSSPVSDLPLLAPIPRLGGTSVRDAQRPTAAGTHGEVNVGGCQRDAKLIIRCFRCLDGRWCERCNCWWCENCFPGRPAGCDQPNHELFLFRYVCRSRIKCRLRSYNRQ